MFLLGACASGPESRSENAAGDELLLHGMDSNSVPPEAIDYTHFPDRMHSLVFRNWTVVEARRMAKVVGTSTRNIRKIAASMGLGKQGPISSYWNNRGYITVLRRNWHLLPYDQLLVLLDMTAKELAFSLREDDFLFVKLGRLKPRCEPLRYTEPDEAARRRAGEIKRIVEASFGVEMKSAADPRFAFLDRFEATQEQVPAVPRNEQGLRYIYSYAATFGDPLLDERLEGYPVGLLQSLAGVGVNGVWMHTVLSQLAPSDIFPKFGEGCERRLANLSKLVRRAARHGIKIYLYMNEPRSQRDSFFKDREDMRGVQEGPYYAVCTSNPKVRQWISDSLAYVFTEVPDLGGVFTITGSENLTNCASHHRHLACPQCKSRTAPDIIAEVNTTIEQGVHRGNPNARVIAWDWGWNDAWVGDIVKQLPKSVSLMSVSEWSKPIDRGGIKSAVGEYSISAVGPGPRASRHWGQAGAVGLKTVAKVQMNLSWEFSSAPYMPVVDLVAQHAHNLASVGVDGIMLSWTLGGHPSPNLEVAQILARKPTPTIDEALEEVARTWFGTEGAPHGRKAWSAMSRAFQEYPYHIEVVYHSPVHVGPSNLLYARPTGYGATMCGIPYDDLKGWCGPYPPDIFAQQMQKVADGWEGGLSHLEKAAASAPPARAADARAQVAFATTAMLHFRSVANQSRFTEARNRLLNNKDLSADARKKLLGQMGKIIEAEAEIARRMFTVARSDSRIGYEASNHYFYLPIDLMEKVINCRYIADHELAGLE